MSHAERISRLASEVNEIARGLKLAAPELPKIKFPRNQTRKALEILNSLSFKERHIIDTLVGRPRLSVVGRKNPTEVWIQYVKRVTPKGRNIYKEDHKSTDLVPVVKHLRKQRWLRFVPLPLLPDERSNPPSNPLGSYVLTDAAHDLMEAATGKSRW